MSLDFKIGSLFPRRADVNASVSVLNGIVDPPASLDANVHSQIAPIGESQTRVPAVSATPSDSELVDDRAATSGLHGILRATDYWFNAESNVLEKEAKDLAEAHARAGLPRQDIPVTEEIEPERVLRSKATQLFEQWQERVRRKLHDSIADICSSLRQDISGLRSKSEWLQNDAADLKDHQSEIQKLNAEEKLQIEARRVQAQLVEDKTVEYGSMLKRWKYLALVALLVIVDWVANVPVFRELLPQEPGSVRAWQNLMGQTERWQASAGIVRLLYRVTFAPDVSLLAFGVVVFLMILAHICGSSLRRVIAFRSEEDPERKSTLQMHIRQATAPLVASALGIALILGFLLWSRAMLKNVTGERRAKVAQTVRDWDAKALEADKKQDISAESEAQRKSKQAQFELEEREVAADYADSISSMNWPIFLLNFTLAITAAVTAYQESKDRVQRLRGASLPEDNSLRPAVNAKLQEIQEVRVRMLQHRARIRDLDAGIRTSLGRARYLNNSNPFQDWEAKANRLDALIPLFRTSNSCLRGLDASNIRAFDIRRPLDLVVMEGESFRVPEELSQIDRDFSEAAAESNRAMARTADLAVGGAA
jgi:hypothetical protein